jgi:hypothetical protein
VSFLDHLLGDIAYGAEVTQLGVIGRGAEVRAADVAPDFFLHFGLFSGKKSRLDPKKFNVIFEPFVRRHSLWRRVVLPRRHTLWRRGTCCAGTIGRRGTDVAPSLAP